MRSKALRSWAQAWGGGLRFLRPWPGDYAGRRWRLGRDGTGKGAEMAAGRALMKNMILIHFEFLDLALST